MSSKCKPALQLCFLVMLSSLSNLSRVTNELPNNVKIILQDEYDTVFH